MVQETKEENIKIDLFWYIFFIFVLFSAIIYSTRSKRKWTNSFLGTREKKSWRAVILVSEFFVLIMWSKQISLFRSCDQNKYAGGFEVWPLGSDCPFNMFKRSNAHGFSLSRCPLCSIPSLLCTVVWGKLEHHGVNWNCCL